MLYTNDIVRSNVRQSRANQSCIATINSLSRLLGGKKRNSIDLLRNAKSAECKPLYQKSHPLSKRDQHATIHVAFREISHIACSVCGPGKTFLFLVPFQIKDQDADAMPRQEQPETPILEEKINKIKSFLDALYILLI